MQARVSTGEIPSSDASPRINALHKWTYAAMIFSFMALGLLNHQFGGDGLMDINIGQWILTHGHIPLHNHFTQAQYGAPFSNTEWGFAVYLAGAYDLGGRIGVYLSLLPWFAVTGLVVGLWLQRVNTRWALMMAGIVGASLLIVSSPRPQVFSYAGFALGLWAIHQARRDRWVALMGFLAIIPLWTNVHMSVVLAPALLANEVLWGRGRYRGRMAAATAVAALLMLLRVGGGTSGRQFFSHVFSAGVVNVIQEWQSPNFHTVAGMLVLPAVVVGLTVFVPRLWRKRVWAGVTWVLVGTMVTLWAIRFAPYFVLGLAALTPEVASPWTPDTGLWRPVRVFWAALGIGLLTISTAMPNFFGPNYPVSAMRFLKQHHAQDVVVYQNWSDAAEFSGVRPWSNGQAQMWATTRWWLPFVQAQGNGADLMAWIAQWDPHTQWILWPASGYHLATPAIHQAGWQEVYQEHTRQGTVGVWHRTSS